MTNQILLNKNRNEEIETPYEGDFWRRQYLAEKLTGYVERLQIGATIAIDAEWGGGKSWFVRNWKADLEQNDFNVIYLDAFESDYIEDPFLTISMEIANKIEATEGKKSIDELKKAIGNAYRAVLPNLPMLLWSLSTSLIGAGYWGQQVAETFKNAKESAGELGEKAGELLNEKLKGHLQAQVENYENEKESLNYFKAELTKVAEKLDKPLVFIIDELDRCKPEFSIRLIERIKHFFDIPNIVFVLAINKKQLEESINSFYGFQTANNYLEKFIDFNIKLFNINNENDSYRGILEEYDRKLALGWNNALIDKVNVFLMMYQPNTRQVINILQKISFFRVNGAKLSYLIIFMLAKDLGLWDSKLKEEYQALKIFREKAFHYMKKTYRYGQVNEANMYEIFKNFLSDDDPVDRINLGHLLESVFADQTSVANPHGINADHIKQYYIPRYNNIELPLDEAWDNYIHCGFLV